MSSKCHHTTIAVLLEASTAEKVAQTSLLNFDIGSRQLLTKGQNEMDPGLQARSRKEFISPSRRMLSFAGSILENDFQPALPGLAPLFPGKSRRNLKAGAAPSGFSFRRLLSRGRPLWSVVQLQHLQPKAKKAKRQVMAAALSRKQSPTP